MKWVVTGSRYGHPYVERVLDALLRSKGTPVQVVCGDAAGVDTQAWDWCVANGFQQLAIQVRVNDALGSPRKFHDRNERMVRMCSGGDRLLAFPNGESRGTWNTTKLCGLSDLACNVIWPNGNQFSGRGRVVVNLAERFLRGRRADSEGPGDL